MVKFSEYFETMVAKKPEWRRAYIDYPSLNGLLGDIKKGLRVVTKDRHGKVVRVAPMSPPSGPANGAAGDAGDGEGGERVRRSAGEDDRVFDTSPLMRGCGPVGTNACGNAQCVSPEAEQQRPLLRADSAENGDDDASTGARTPIPSAANAATSAVVPVVPARGRRLTTLSPFGSPGATGGRVRALTSVGPAAAEAAAASVAPAATRGAAMSREASNASFAVSATPTNDATGASSVSAATASAPMPVLGRPQRAAAPVLSPKHDSSDAFRVGSLEASGAVFGGGGSAGASGGRNGGLASSAAPALVGPWGNGREFREVRLTPQAGNASSGAESRSASPGASGALGGASGGGGSPAVGGEPAGVPPGSAISPVLSQQSWSVGGAVGSGRLLGGDSDNGSFGVPRGAALGGGAGAPDVSFGMGGWARSVSATGESFAMASRSHSNAAQQSPSAGSGLPTGMPPAMQPTNGSIFAAASGVANYGTASSVGQKESNGCGCATGTVPSATAAVAAACATSAGIPSGRFTIDHCNAGIKAQRVLGAAPTAVAGANAAAQPPRAAAFPDHPPPLQLPPSGCLSRQPRDEAGCAAMEAVGRCRTTAGGSCLVLCARIDPTVADSPLDLTRHVDHAVASATPPTLTGTGNFATAMSPRSGMDNLTCEPQLSEFAASSAIKFEELLLAETGKAQTFAAQSYETFLGYYEASRPAWTDKNKSNVRTKENVRYLHNEVTHLITFIETNCLCVRTAIKKYLNSHPFFIGEAISEDYLLPPFADTVGHVQHLRQAIEELFADVFSGGSIESARSRIVGRHASPRQSFRAGFFLAMIVATIGYWFHVFVELRPDDHVLLHFRRLFPVIRLFVSLTFALVCWSWVLYICQTYKINYLYVFELSQTASATWMQCLEFSLMMFWLCLLFGIAYVRSELADPGYRGVKEQSITFVSPYIFPTFIALFVLSLAFPIRRVFRRTRNSYFRTFFNICKLPFGYVRFIEFFVADWGTSLPIPCADILYTVCFYTATPKESFENSSLWNTCAEVRANYQFPVAALPFFWRGCQTLKMYLRTKNKAHIINHFKYVACLLAYVTQWWFALFPSPTVFVIQWAVHVISQLYAYIWDVLMDWGFVRGEKRQMMFKSKRTYAYAVAFDAFGRLFFIPAAIWIQPAIGNDTIFFIQGLLEIFRRSMWSIFRIENENVNNLETYRSIDFVPQVVLPDEE